MEEKDISRLFFNVVEDSAQNTDAVRQVFSTLILTTLRYRDYMLESRGVVITVDDVRKTLSWLVPALTTGRLPVADDEAHLDLLKLWLDELKNFGNPHLYLK
jgi:hypothetical protein